MRVPLGWLSDYVALPADATPESIAAALTAFDLKLEEIVTSGISGPLTVGRVLTREPETHKNGKTVNWCTVDVGEDEPRGIVCGAHNFEPGDLVVAALPGTVLPGGFTITARKTYGHVSDGMICSTAELGLGGESDGIVVLDVEAAPGADAIALLGLDDAVLDLEVNPDRAYALSLRGVARDAALALGVDFTDPAEREVPAQGESYPVRVEDAAANPVFVTREVSGFDPASPTPPFIARRVEQAGMRSLGLAIDVTNYVMLELGQPIHGYDKDQLQGPIVVRRAQPGERLVTLDDVDRALDPEDLLITDDRGAIGLAGVMGGSTTELSASTANIVIEAAHFDPVTIGRTARRHKLPSEASKRFERGVDPALPARAAQRVAELLVEHGGGRIEPGLTVVGEVPAREPVTVPIGLPARITGVEIDDATVVSALEANGCAVARLGEDIAVTPPSWRSDLNDPYDVVEEVLRVVGYDQVPSVLPAAPAGRGRTVTQRLRRRAGLALAGAGLTEVKTFPFAGPADFDRLGLAADDARRAQVLLENPLSAEEPGLATTLLPGLLKTLVLNVGRGHEDVAIFETGRVFRPAASGAGAPLYGVDRRPTPDEVAALDAALPDQPEVVTLALVGQAEPAGWWGEGRAVSWADAVAAVRELARQLHVDLEIVSAEYAPWHPGRCAQIVVDGTVIGHAGELHPRVAREFGFAGRVALAEVDLTRLIAAAPEHQTVESFSPYPVAKEDLALVVDEAVTAAEVGAVLAGSSDLIESVRLFDVYRGEQLGEGQKSLAFALRLRAPDRTLSEEDVRSVREAATAAAQTAGAVLRA